METKNESKENITAKPEERSDEQIPAVRRSHAGMLKTDGCEIIFNPEPSNYSIKTVKFLIDINIWGVEYKKDGIRKCGEGDHAFRGNYYLMMGPSSSIKFNIGTEVEIIA